MIDQETVTQLISKADYLIIGFIALSVVISFIRGFVKEAISLITWILAIWISINYCSLLSDLLVHEVQMPTLRLLIAFAVLFLGTLILGAIVNYVVSLLVKKTGLSGTDRILGVVFGLTRGVLVIAVIVMAANLTHLPQQPAWQTSLLLPQFQMMAQWLNQFLPSGLSI